MFQYLSSVPKKSTLQQKIHRFVRRCITQSVLFYVFFTYIPDNKDFATAYVKGGGRSKVRNTR